MGNKGKLWINFACIKEFNQGKRVTFNNKCKFMDKLGVHQRVYPVQNYKMYILLNKQGNVIEDMCKVMDKFGVHQRVYRG